MTRFLAGGVAALLLLVGGLFVWQGNSQSEEQDTPMMVAGPPEIPIAAADAPQRGDAPPEPPAAKSASREERRFNRYDRDRNNLVSRVEMMSTRTAAFRKLDRDGNNLLSFEEWAAATGERFSGADGDKSGGLSRVEFVKTAPKRPVKPACRC
ncbi:MAG: hypothetical protein RLZZ58_1396 [Pseudomonadota bacterium]